MIAAFSKKHRDIAVDSRSQGRTTDSDLKELTYAQMALAVNGFMDQLHVKKALERWERYRIRISVDTSRENR